MTATTTPAVQSGPVMSARGRRSALALFGAALVIAAVFAIGGLRPGAWGLTPILLYAGLALAGLDVVLATVAALVVAAVMVRATPVPLGAQLAESLGAFTTTIGAIILLGAGLGQVAQRTGAAQALIGAIMGRIGLRTPTRVQLGVMVSSLVLVGALGTLAGANSILAPIVIPICARTKWRPPAVAAMLHGAGAVGLFLGPFSPPCVTIRAATGMAYGAYVLQAGLPLAVVVLVTSFVMTRWIQRRATQEYTAVDAGDTTADHATADDTTADDTTADTRRERSEAAAGTAGPSAAVAGRAAVVFLLSLLALTIYGIVVKAPFTFAIFVMIVTAALTGLAGGLGPTQTLHAVFEGARRLIWLFFLFWLLDPLLVLVDESGAFASISSTLTPAIRTSGAFVFLLLIIVLGILHSVPGAAVAQVVLLNRLFGSLVTAFAVPAGAWALVLLAVSQVDQHGPVPGADMIGQMGLARSNSLRLMLFHGWAVLITGTALVLAVVALRT